MFERYIVDELKRWKNSDSRKPLVLRGARQVGKTSAVNLFSSQYSQYIYLNLEREKDKNLFIKYQTVEDIVKVIFLENNKQLSKIADTLLFIDEIQETPKAISQLRYFYEEYPDLSVIAAGSMLETIFDRGVNFPVGRVEYRVLRPVSFSEFLIAMGEMQALELYNEIPMSGLAHSKLLNLFHLYTLIGGMPEVVKRYAENRDLSALKTVYESLIIAYFDDAEKYAKNQNQVQLFRHAIRSVFFEAGNRIKFQGFGASSYGSREMSEILRILEKTMLIGLVFPTTQTDLPYLPDIKKSPRLQALDTGMLNFFAGLQTELIGSSDLNDYYQGKITEHIVGQELLASSYNLLNTLHFWVREKKQSDAELDFLYPFEGKMIPVEVKSGKNGKLRSLHQYVDTTTECPLAVRFYAGELCDENHHTIQGKKFRLLNIPYFLCGKLDEYLKYYLQKSKFTY